MLIKLLVQTAQKNTSCKFVVGGAQYPENFPWGKNISFVAHIPPSEHASFYCSCKFTLNVTRAAMAQTGYSPSGRLFEAAGCGVPVISDNWPGIDHFFSPGEEIIVASDSDDVTRALKMPENIRSKMAYNAYKRVLKEHTAMHRVKQLEKIIGEF